MDVCRAAACVAACMIASFAWAAAPVGIETEMPVPEGVASTPARIYELETEMVVHNWVLCVSRTVAEKLVHAREEGADQAWSAYATLKEARKCGQFAELRVILQEPLYVSATESGYDARVYGALVSLADNWASAFVISGGLPER